MGGLRERGDKGDERRESDGKIEGARGSERRGTDGGRGNKRDGRRERERGK